MNKIKNFNGSKGFTLIELLTVIAILGILVLLTAPKFSTYISEVKLTQIKADIKTHETALAAKLTEDSNFLNELNTIEKENLEMYKENESLFTIEGKVERNYEFDGIYLDFPKEEFEIKTKLKGKFILDSEGKIYYQDSNVKIKNKVITDEEGNEVRPDGIVILKDKSGIIMPDGKFIPAVTKDDFKLGFKANGYYSYVGNEREVYIPSDLKLNGEILTDGSHLFNGSFVEKVVLLDNEITNMTYMFRDSQAIALDLSSFNTENVNNMYAMFQGVKSKSIDLMNFNTSNVSNMSYMFYQSKSKSINLSSFDTSKVKSMQNMFRESQIEFLNLNHFNTSNVNNMFAMFFQSQAKIIDISSFDTSNVTTMQSMFNKVQAKSIDVSSFNTKNLKNTNYMFVDFETEILDLSLFDMENVESWENMFMGSKIKTGYARTQKDVDILNSSSNKPEDLIFTIK